MGDISFIHVKRKMSIKGVIIHLKPCCIYHNIVTMEIVSVFKGVWINIYPFLGYAFVHLHVLTLAYMYYITRMNNEPMGCMVKMFGTQTNQWSNIILEWWDHTLNMCTKTRRNIPSICYIIHYSGWAKYIKTRDFYDRTISKCDFSKGYANNSSI